MKFDTDSFDDWFVEGGGERLLEDIKSELIQIESRDYVDRTPLMVAIERSAVSIVRELIILGANVNSKSDDGETCLLRAIDSNLEILTLLLNAGANIELEGSNFDTPLRRAAIRGNLTVIDLLLDRGANIEAGGEMGETALMEACRSNQLEAVRKLLERGASLEARDNFGQTALGHARSEGKECIEKFTKKRPNK